MTWRLALVAVAVGVALVPLPAAAVERYYSTGLYPRLQGMLTPLTNLVPVALLDVAGGLLALGLLARVVHLTRRAGARRALGPVMALLLTVAACLYLVFCAAWGLNYRRLPLEQTLDYDVSRVTRAAGLAFAREAVGRVNASHPGPARADARALSGALAEVVRTLGGRAPVPGVPKASLLQWYFRHAAIDGLTDPFFLEIILNPDLLEAERPVVLAHEWAHLAGYADESEANFVAWLACARADPAARYSGWLAAWQHAVSGLTREERSTLPPLSEAVRSDLRAMAQRFNRSSPVVRTVARDVYDSYLKAHRVEEGIDSYGAVLRLMIGTRFDERGAPVLRPR